VIGIIFVLGGDQNDPNVLKSRDEFANNVIPYRHYTQLFVCLLVSQIFNSKESTNRKSPSCARTPLFISVIRSFRSFDCDRGTDVQRSYAKLIDSAMNTVPPHS
jgi:hypothetical protein